MNLTDTVLGEAWYWAAWAVWVPLFVRIAFRAPWRQLADSTRLNVWLGMVVLLTLVWSMKAGIKPGLDLHLLGATIFTLCCGPHLAFIGLSLVTLGITLNGAAGPFAFAGNALLLGGCGVFISHLVSSVVYRWLPRHFFIYIFVNGFVGAALSILGVGLAATAWLATADAYDWSYLSSEYLPYFLLLGFAEAWLSGMVMTLFVVYRPHWVVSFDDQAYLAGK